MQPRTLTRLMSHAAVHCMPRRAVLGALGLHCSHAAAGGTQPCAQAIGLLIHDTYIAVQSRADSCGSDKADWERDAASSPN